MLGGSLGVKKKIKNKTKVIKKGKLEEIITKKCKEKSNRTDLNVLSFLFSFCPNHIHYNIF